MLTSAKRKFIYRFQERVIGKVTTIQFAAALMMITEGLPCHSCNCNCLRASALRESAAPGFIGLECGSSGYLFRL